MTDRFWTLGPERARAAQDEPSSRENELVALLVSAEGAEKEKLQKELDMLRCYVPDVERSLFLCVE